MPDIFRGIGLNPLDPANSFYLLWMILGFLIVSSVLVVGLGRLGDIVGRVRIYNLGFVIYTSRVAAPDDRLDDRTAGCGLAHGLPSRAGHRRRVPHRQLGGDSHRCIPGQSARARARHQQHRRHQRRVHRPRSSAGLLAPINWRLVFLVSVPFGLFGTVWAYLKLEERGVRRRVPIDWLGNVTFAIGLILVMIGITYGIEPYKSDPMGWTSPFVLTALVLGAAFLAALRGDRGSRRESDVPSRVVPHSRVHLRHALELSRRRRSRWTHVHADHLVAGDLVTRARIQLHVDAALGGHLHDSVDGRLPARRSAARDFCRTVSAHARLRPAG